MTEKEIYRSLKRDFFVKELEAKGIDCSGLSLEDVLVLAEENNITGINDINPEPLEKTSEKIQFAQPEELLKDTNVFEPMPEAKVMEDIPELKKEDFMEEFAKEMDDEISKGREEIEKSKAYLENLLKSNGIDTKDLTYTYMLDLAAKLQKDLEPKEEEKIEETSEEKHIWDDSEISKDYKEEPSEPLMIKVPEKEEEKHECTCGECNCDKPKEEHLTRRGKILKGFLVKELSAIEAINKDWLKSAYYLDIINAANAFPHIMNKWETSLEFEEYKLATEDAINNVINFVSDRKDEIMNDVVESKLDEAIHGDTGSLNVLENILEKSTNPTAMVVNRSFMHGFLYSKTDLGIIRLNNMTTEELFEECKKFVGFKSSLDKFNFILDFEPKLTGMPKSNTTSKSIKGYSTKELQEELIKREGVESYWLSPDSSYTLDIGKPANSCHSAVYVNGGGPLWIIFKKD